MRTGCRAHLRAARTDLRDLHLGVHSGRCPPAPLRAALHTPMKAVNISNGGQPTWPPPHLWPPRFSLPFNRAPDAQQGQGAAGRPKEAMDDVPELGPDNDK